MKMSCRTIKFVFISNFLNHHQVSLCNALAKVAEEFYFVATMPVSEARQKLGYADANSAYNYVIRAYESEAEHQRALDLCRDCDVVIIGSAPEVYVQQRLKLDKLTFRYSERIYKNGPEWHKYPVRLLRYFWRNGRHKSLYLLCASAYTAADYARTGTFLNKAYQWGYFPEFIAYDVQAMIEKKQGDIPQMLWCGRFLDWKHPGDALIVARLLKEAGYRFELNLIGTGPMESELQQMIGENDLSDCVRMPGPMKPEEVRAHMERANIYLFTSDRGEGWGAVLNESMNSGCAVVASHAIGSVPFLMKDGENGLIYRSGDVDMLYEKVRFLLDHPEEQVRLGTAAYETMADVWNAEAAAERLLVLIDCIQNGKETPYQNGPCSRAQVLREDWM